jgi:protein-arginine kinase
VLDHKIITALENKFFNKKIKINTTNATIKKKIIKKFLLEYNLIRDDDTQIDKYIEYFDDKIEPLIKFVEKYVLINIDESSFDTELRASILSISNSSTFGNKEKEIFEKLKKYYQELKSAAAAVAAPAAAVAAAVAAPATELTSYGGNGKRSKK